MVTLSFGWCRAPSWGHHPWRWIRLQGPLFVKVGDDSGLQEHPPRTRSIRWALWCLLAGSERHMPSSFRCVVPLFIVEVGENAHVRLGRCKFSVCMLSGVAQVPGCVSSGFSCRCPGLLTIFFLINELNSSPAHIKKNCISVWETCTHFHLLRVVVHCSWGSTGRRIWTCDLPTCCLCVIDTHDSDLEDESTFIFGSIGYTDMIPASSTIRRLGEEVTTSIAMYGWRKTSYLHCCCLAYFLSS
jgi:hypothetical protein